MATARRPKATPRIRNDARLAAFDPSSKRPENARLLTDGTRQIISELPRWLRERPPRARLACDTDSLDKPAMLTRQMGYVDEDTAEHD